MYMYRYAVKVRTCMHELKVTGKELIPYMYIYLNVKSIRLSFAQNSFITPSYCKSVASPSNCLTHLFRWKL